MTNPLKEEIHAIVTLTFKLLLLSLGKAKRICLLLMTVKSPWGTDEAKTGTEHTTPTYIYSHYSRKN